MGTAVQYLTFEQIGITFAVVALAFSSIILVLNTVKAIREARDQAKKPTEDRFKEHDGKLQDHEERIVTLEQCCEEVHGKLENDYEFQKNAAETNKLILKSIKQLLKHSIDGDDTDGLHAMEDAIDNYLVEHQK